MNYLFTIAFRNLLRQKRRNILLGAAIAIGTAFLILAHSFAHGISDVLFNQIVVYVAGHIGVGFTKGGNVSNQVFHDGPRIRAIAREVLSGVEQVDEAIGVFARAIGNGKADNVIMVGMDMESEISEELAQEHLSNFKLLEGRFEDLLDTTIEHPVVLAKQKADYLNLSLHDVLKVRFTDIHGQHHAERLTVVAIFEPANVFMSAPIFLGIKDIKSMLGYGPYDIAQLQFRIKRPRENARRLADSLHAALTPSVAVMRAELSGPRESADGAVMAFRTDSTFTQAVREALRLEHGDTVARDDIILSAGAAEAWPATPGDTIDVAYTAKHTGRRVSFRLPVTAVAAPGALPGAVALVNDKVFYDQYYRQWPAPPDSATLALLPAANSPLYEALGLEWMLMERASTTKDVQKRYQEISQKGWEAIAIDVNSMYESASAIVNLEYALGLITFIAVMVLFVIILVGVVNTLRMTIRERTREIGTTRAIGMQRTDVRNVFLLETGLLALFASLVGTAAAFLGMWALSVPVIEASDNPMGMLLVEGRLHFSPTIGGIVFFIGFIVFLAMAAAWFPARRAARLSAADALRHFE
jgi:ABC-type lipoprotein release transport system permease subunit